MTSLYNAAALADIQARRLRDLIAVRQGDYRAQIRQARSYARRADENLRAGNLTIATRELEFAAERTRAAQLVRDALGRARAAGSYDALIRAEVEANRGALAAIGVPLQEAR